MQKLNEPSREKQHNFLLSLIIASAFIIIYSFSAQYGGDGTNDDFAIGIALSGRIPEANMSLFVNAAFCNIVALLNQGIPDINWFWLIERFVAFASLSSLLFVGLEKHNEYPALLVLAACACVLLLAGCTYQGNFSYVASFATVAGGVVLLIGIKTPYSANYKKPLTAIGVSLMVIGFSIRIESFLLFMPFFFAAIIWAILSDFKSHSISIYKYIPIVAVVACCIALFSYDQIVWNSNTELSHWKQYNHARSVISDYPMPPYEDAAEQLSNYGVSENDYFMLRNWITADSAVFTTETLENVASLTTTQSITGKIQMLPQSTVDYLLRLSNEGLLLGFIALYVILIAQSKSGRALSSFSILLALALCIYFVATGRFPQRVEYPLWIYAFSIMTIEFTPRSHLRDAGFCAFWKGAASFCLLFAFAAQIPAFSIHEIKSSFTQTTLSPQDALLEYEADYPNDVFVFDVETYTSVEMAFKEKNLPSSDFLTHNATLGGWSVESPYYISRNEIMGSSSILKSLADSDSFHLLTTDPSVCDTIGLFLNEHYKIDPQVTIKATPLDGVYLCDFHA